MLLVDIELVDPRTGNKVSKRLAARVIVDTEKNQSLSCEAATGEFERVIADLIVKAVKVGMGVNKDAD